MPSSAAPAALLIAKSLVVRLSQQEAGLEALAIALAEAATNDSTLNLEKLFIDERGTLLQQLHAIERVETN